MGKNRRETLCEPWQWKEYEAVANTSWSRLRAGEELRNSWMQGNAITRGGIEPGWLVFHNVQVVMSRLSKPQVSRSSDSEEMYQAQAGAFRGNCRVAPLLQQRVKQHPPKRYHAISEKFLEHFEGSSGDVPLSCSLRISHPVVAVERYEYSNLFHTGTDFFNTWLVMEMEGLSASSAQLMLFDGHDESPNMDPVWQRVFSPNLPIIRPESFRQHDTVCFDHLVLVLEGYRSPIYYGDERRLCEEGSSSSSSSSSSSGTRSSTSSSANLFHQFAAAMRAAFGLPSFLPIPPRNATPELTLVVRRDYTPHPRSAGRINRKFSNEQEVIQALNEFCLLNDCHLNIVDTAAVSFEEQLKVMARTNMLIGIHGAALFHVSFLPPFSHLLELGFGGHLFLNLAHWGGSTYSDNNQFSRDKFSQDIHVDPHLILQHVKQFLTTFRSRDRLDEIHQMRQVIEDHIPSIRDKIQARHRKKES